MFARCYDMSLARLIGDGQTQQFSWCSDFRGPGMYACMVLQNSALSRGHIWSDLSIADLPWEKKMGA